MATAPKPKVAIGWAAPVYAAGVLPGRLYDGMPVTVVTVGMV